MTEKMIPLSCPFCLFEFTISEVTSDIATHFYYAHALTKRQSIDLSKWLRKLIPLVGLV